MWRRIWRSSHRKWERTALQQGEPSGGPRGRRGACGSCNQPRRRRIERDGVESVLIIHMCDYYSQEQGQAGTRKPMREASRRWMPRRSDGGKNMGGENLLLFIY